MGAGGKGRDRMMSVRGMPLSIYSAVSEDSTSPTGALDRPDYLHVQTVFFLHADTPYKRATLLTNGRS